jgi:sigma-B regulation protein RsbU (phosphoserine phosphatase)
VLLALLSVSFLTACLVGFIAIGLGISTLKGESYKKLTAIRELKANQIENYFRLLDSQVLNLSRSDDIAVALKPEPERMKDPALHAFSRSMKIRLKNFVEAFGYMDLFLVSLETDKVVYSVNQSIEPGTSLTEGAVSETYLGRVYKKAASSGQPDVSFQTDFERFWLSGGTFSSFIAAAVYDGTEKTGVLIGQVPIDWINGIMTDNQKWGDTGLGETGETYLAGDDNLLRNQSRFFVEDSVTYFNRLQSAGIQPGVVVRIRSLNSSIGVQPVGMDEIRVSHRGETGTGIFTDYRGEKILAAFKPLKIKDLDWIIVSKVDQAEVLVAISVLVRKFAIYMILLIIFVVPFSLFLANGFSRPVEALARANDQLKVQSAAMKSAANGIIITDTRGIVKWVNPAFTKLTGYDFGEIVGNNLKMLNSGNQGREFFQSMWSKILAGEVWHDEIVNRRKDGSLYTEEMTITPIPDNQGGISQFVAIKNDISERKRLEQIVKNANERMEGELNVARDIQMSMLPLKFEAAPGQEDIDVHARLIPAREVGGDFYDYFFLDDEHFCFVVGDVSGKGVPAALFMAVTKALIKAGAHGETSTAGILTRVNSEISRDNENSMFITVFLAILNTTTGHLVYTNAGHNPSFVLRQGGGPMLKLSDLHGMVVGAFEGVQYKETVVLLNRGDVVFAYTDGVTESRNPLDQLYSEERLREFLLQYQFRGCVEMVTDAVSEVVHFEDGAEQADDITVLAVNFRQQDEDSVIDHLFTTLTNKIENIGVFTAEFEKFATKHSLPNETVQKINIVFDELLTNTISYAYQDDLEHEIEIRIRFYGKNLTVTIMDDGIPYNPFDRSDPDTSLDLDSREIGGLGVHLVKLLVDEYHYEYKSQLKKNITSFKKRI